MQQYSFQTAISTADVQKKHVGILVVGKKFLRMYCPSSSGGMWLERASWAFKAELAEGYCCALRLVSSTSLVRSSLTACSV